MSIEVVDNFLDEIDFMEIKNLLEGKDMPWFFNKVVGMVNTDTQFEELANIYNYQLTHVFYSDWVPNSQFFPLMVPIVNKLDAKALIKIKANLQPRTHIIIENGFHIDYNNVKTCVYYLNTNNGYTKFMSGEIINSQENRAVIFDSNMQHTGTTCTDERSRIVININYIGQD